MPIPDFFQTERLLFKDYGNYKFKHYLDLKVINFLQWFLLNLLNHPQNIFFELVLSTVME